MRNKRRLPQLDHDNSGGPGGAKAPPALEWVVTRKRGLHQVPPAEAREALRAGGRMATPRDLAIGGAS